MILSKIVDCVHLLKDRYNTVINSIDVFFSKEPDFSKYSFTTSLLDDFHNDLRLLREKYPAFFEFFHFFEREPLCKNKKQRCIALMYLWLLCFLAFGLVNNQWFLFSPLSVLPNVDFQDYLGTLGLKWNDYFSKGMFGYTIMVSYSIAISTITLNILTKYVIGETESSIFTFEGAMSWWFKTYLAAISLNFSKEISYWAIIQSIKSNDTKILTILMVPALVFCVCFMMDCFQSFTSVFLFHPFFNLFCGLWLHYSALILFNGIDALLGGEIIDALEGMTFTFLIWIQIIWHYFCKTRPSKWLLRILRFFFTAPLGMFILYITCMIYCIILRKSLN